MSVSSVSEHQILEALRQAPQDRWPEVLAFVQHLHCQYTPDPGPKHPTATELLQLSLAEREAILAKQAARAEIDYATNPELTAFEAYGEDDLHVDSSDTQAK